MCERDLIALWPVVLATIAAALGIACLI